MKYTNSQRPLNFDEENFQNTNLLAFKRNKIKYLSSFWRGTNYHDFTCSEPEASFKWSKFPFHPIKILCHLQAQEPSMKKLSNLSLTFVIATSILMKPSKLILEFILPLPLLASIFKGIINILITLCVWYLSGLNTNPGPSNSHLINRCGAWVFASEFKSQCPPLQQTKPNHVIFCWKLKNKHLSLYSSSM